MKHRTPYEKVPAAAGVGHHGSSLDRFVGVPFVSLLIGCKLMLYADTQSLREYDSERLLQNLSGALLSPFSFILVLLSFPRSVTEMVCVEDSKSIERVIVSWQRELKSIEERGLVLNELGCLLRLKADKAALRRTFLSLHLPSFVA